MIHGGLRYLVAGDVAVVKESASERATLHRIAPHLAQKTPYVIPTSSVRSKLILRGALWAYERLGGVERADHHEVWSKAELAEKEPLIERSRLNGAVVYPEFLTDDSRLTVATVRSAIDHGATVATYLRGHQHPKGTDVQYRCGVNPTGRDDRAHNQCPCGCECGGALG